MTIRRLARFVSLTTFLLVGALTSTAHAGDGASLVPLLPPTADAVVGVNLEQLRGTSLFERATAMARSQDDVTEALEGISADGFDPITAAQTVVMASEEVSDNATDRMIVLVEVAYPGEALTQRLTSEGFELSEVHGVSVYRKSQSTVALLSPSLLAVGHFDLVSGAVAAHTNNGTNTLPAALSTQVSSVDKSGAVWFAATLPSNPQGAQALRASFNLSSGLAFAAVVVMDSAERAATTATEFTTQRDALAQAPEVAGLGLAPVLAGTTISANGADLAVALTLDAATWGTVVTTLSALVEEELR